MKYWGKRGISGLLAVVILSGLFAFLPGEIFTAAATRYGNGDVDGDGRVSVYDALCILREGQKNDDASLIRSDVNVSGQVDRADAEFLLAYLVGKQTTLGTERFTYSCSSDQWGKPVPFWSWEYRRVSDSTFSDMVYGYVSAYSKNMYFTGNWTAYPYSYADSYGKKVHPSSAADTVRTFTAPVTGTVVLHVKADRNGTFTAAGGYAYNKTPTSVAVYLNTDRIDPVNGDYRLISSSVSFQVTLSVKKGDKVRVCIGGVKNVNSDAVTLDTSVEYISFSSSGSQPGVSDLFGQHYIAVTDQKNNRIVVYDVFRDWNDSAAVLWSWSPTTANKYTSAQVKGFSNCTDAKLRVLPDGREVVLMCASGTLLTMVEYPSGKNLWATLAPSGSNPHSIELLPDGNIVAAESTGAKLQLFAASQGKTTAKDYAFPGAHGVLWDPEYNLLWAVGDYQLRAYAYTGTTADPALELQYSVNLSSNWGHDLSAYYGHKELLLISNGAQSVVYNKETRTFSTLYAGSEFLNYSAVKGFSMLPFGNGGELFAVVCADGKAAMEVGEIDRDWRTRTVYFVLKKQENGTTVYEGLHRGGSADQYYKARLWNKDYQ